MMPFPEIGGLSGGDSSSQNLVLVPTLLVHRDGTLETAYIQQLPHKEHSTLSSQKWQKKLTVLYLTVGTIALALSAYATVKVLHKSK